MKKLLVTLAFLLFGTVAHASNCPTYPYTLTNGQTADANQVMANFNSILTCANNTLTTGGANSSITSLSGLTTPLSVPQGGTGLSTLTIHNILIGEGSVMGGLSPGTSGYILTSNGPGADPTFQAVPVGGSVTSVSTNNGLTGGPITSSGTIGLATIAANNALVNTTSGSAVPTAAALPSCSTSASALIYTTNTGFGCQTLAGLGMNTFTDTQNLTVSSGPGLMNLNQTAPGSYNNWIAFKKNGTSQWLLSDQTNSASEFELFNFNTSTADWLCSFTTDICNFANTPTAGSTALVLTNDSRFGGLTQNGQCSYTLVIGDAGKQIYCNTAGAHTLQVPANGSVALNVGTKVDVVNDCSAGVMTIAITTDTLVWFTAGTTGSRSLAACGEATLTKVGTTRWIITGVGLT